MRPRPTRVPRYEAMVLGPLCRRGAARALARAPMREWGGGGLPGGSAAAALGLPLAPGATGMATAPPVRARSGGQPGGGRRLFGERPRRDMHQPLAQESPRPTLSPNARHDGDADQGPLPACGGPPAGTDQVLGANVRGGGGATR